MSFILKHYKNSTLGLITGFIVGSLGVVWPWKIKIYKLNFDGRFLLDSNGNNQIENYQRFVPELNYETLFSIFLILIGLAIVIVLDLYGNRKRSYS